MKIRRYLSFLVLLLFLFPQIGSAIHAFEHVNDFHCTEKASYHLHEQDHNCNLCKVNLTKNALNISAGYIAIQLSFFSEVSFAYNAFKVSSLVECVFLRGPPLLS